MDYAAALRATPTGPAVRLDTTPLAKAQSQAPSPKPAKVEAEETVHVIEEETVPTAAIASVPSKPPSNAGLSPTVRFVLRIPASTPSDKDALSASSEVNVESSDSDSETEEDTTGATASNGAKSKSSSGDAKATVFSAQDLDNSHMRQSDLVSLLEKYAEDRTWELEGGFKFSKPNKGSGKSSSGAIHDLDLSTVTLSLKWLSAIIELLRSKTSTNIAAGGGAFISIARVENQIRVIRISGGHAGKELWLAFDDVVLEIREQAKLYLKVANRIEQILERRESQLADKQRKDAAQRRKAVSNKLHTAAFTSMLDTLHGLLASSTEFPDLSNKFQVLEADLAQQRRRIKEENQDMINILFAHIPSNFAEANLSHIAAKLEPPQEEAEGSDSPQVEPSSSPAATAPKKLSKKDQAAADKAAKEVEAERKKQQEAEADANRKAAEAARREKAEKLAALQADQKRKQTIANPFTHLEAFSESAQAKLEQEQETAKEHAVKRAAEAKIKQEQDRLNEAARIAAEKAEEAKSKATKIAASATAEKATKAADDAKKAAQKAAEDAKKAATRASQREAEDKKKAAAERAAAEKAVAERKKAEKAERHAAHQAAERAAAEKRQAAATSSSSPAAPVEKRSGRDRSERQRKAEQIEAKGLEKQRKGQISAIAAQTKKSDNTNMYITIGVGGVIALVVIYMIMAQFTASV